MQVDGVGEAALARHMAGAFAAGMAGEQFVAALRALGAAADEEEKRLVAGVVEAVERGGDDAESVLAAAEKRRAKRAQPGLALQAIRGARTLETPDE